MLLSRLFITAVLKSYTLFCKFVPIKENIMKIGDIDLGAQPLFLAPMEDVTDPSFRYMCKRFGADVVTTEFISSDGLIRDAWKSRAKLNIDEAERPVGIQIYGHLIEPMVEAARIAAPTLLISTSVVLLRRLRAVELVRV